MQESDYGRIFNEVENEKRLEEERQQEKARIYAEQEQRKYTVEGEKLANELLAKFADQKQTVFKFSYIDSVREVVNNQVVTYREAENYPIQYDDGTITATGRIMNTRLAHHGLQVVCIRELESNDPGSNKWEYTHSVMLGNGSSFNKTDKAEGSYYRNEKIYEISIKRVVLPNNAEQQSRQYSSNTNSDKSGIATASLVLGIVSLFFCMWFVSPVALILGIIGRKQTQTKKGYATAGIVMGLIGTVLMLLVIALYVAVIINPDFKNVLNKYN